MADILELVKMIMYYNRDDNKCARHTGAGPQPGSC